MGAPMKMGARTLLRSWAMPAASMPTLSRRLVRRMRSSRRFRSVMSVTMLRRGLGWPRSSRMTVELNLTMMGMPSRLRSGSSPRHSPWASRAALAAAIFSRNSGPKRSSIRRPTAPDAVQRERRSAPRFQKVTQPPSSLTTMTSGALSRSLRTRRSACLRALRLTREPIMRGARPEALRRIWPRSNTSA